MGEGRDFVGIVDNQKGTCFDGVYKVRCEQNRTVNVIEKNDHVARQDGPGREFWPGTGYKRNVDTQRKRPPRWRP